MTTTAEQQRAYTSRDALRVQRQLDKVLEVVMAGATTSAEASAACGMSPRRCAAYLNVLAAKGLVRCVSERGRVGQRLRWAV